MEKWGELRTGQHEDDLERADHDTTQGRVGAERRGGGCVAWGGGGGGVGGGGGGGGGWGGCAISFKTNVSLKCDIGKSRAKSFGRTAPEKKKSGRNRENGPRRE